MVNKFGLVDHEVEIIEGFGFTPFSTRRTHTDLLFLHSIVRRLCGLPMSIGLKVASYATRAKPRFTGGHADPSSPIDVSDLHADILDCFIDSL